MYGIAAFSALSALLCIAIGIFFYAQAKHEVETWIHAQGVVIGVESGKTASSNSTAYYPLVQFEDQEGNAHEFRGSRGSFPSRYKRGDEVDVLYDPAEPETARVHGFVESWVGVIICVVLGGLGLLFSVGLAIVGRIVAKKKMAGVPRDQGSTSSGSIET